MKLCILVIASIFSLSLRLSTNDSRQTYKFEVPKTQIAEVSDSLLIVFKKNWKYAIIATPNDRFLNLDSLSISISHLKSWDIKNVNEFTFSKKECDGIIENTWTPKSNDNPTQLVQRLDFNYHYVDTQLNQENQVLINEYIITRNSKPFNVQLVMSDKYSFEKLTIDSITYLPNKYERIINKIVYKAFPLFALELVGLWETQDIFDKRKKACR